MGKEEAPSEQSVFVAVCHIHTSKADSLTQMAHPCNLCDPILKDILHLDEHKETRHGLKPYTCGACGRQFWFSANFDQHQKLYDVEKFLRDDKGKTSFVTNCRACEEPPLSEKPFACKEEQKNFQASLGSHQQKATHSRRKARSPESGQALHIGQIRYKCIEWTRLCSTRESTLEKSLMSAANVGKLSAAKPHLSSTRGSIQEKSLTSAANVEKPLAAKTTLLSTKEFIPERCLISVVSVANTFAITPT